MLHVALVWAALAAAPTQDIVNQQWGFQSSYPAGWVVQQGTMGPIYVSAAPPAPETLVRCNTTAEKVPQSKGQSQSAINQSLQESIGPEFWSAQIFGRFQKVKVESAVSRLHPAGIQVQEAVVSYEDQLDGKPVQGRTQSTIFVTPGVTFSISCNAQSQKYAKYKGDFLAVVNSFRLNNANTVNAAPPDAAQVSLVSFDAAVKADAVAAGVALTGQ